MPVVWYTKRQIGANLFDLVRNDDGTFVSTCVGHVETEKPRTVPKIRFFKVPSSSDPDHPHTVTVHPDGNIYCDDKCKGFGYRRNCSHCDEVRAILAKEAENGRAN